MAKINKFSVFGLFGFLDVDIPIRDNKVILVGVNGLGKSTILTLFYYVLSNQVYKLVKTDFQKVEITIDGKKFSLKRESLEHDIFDTQKLNEFIPRSIAQSIQNNRNNSLIREFIFSNTFKSELVDPVSEILHIPPRHVHRIYKDLTSISNLDLFKSNSDSERFRESVPEKAKNVAEKILFLPTYRRIEKDLSELFPYMNSRQHREINSAIEEAKERRRGSSIELIEFGMEDVQRKIDRILSELKDTAHTTFKKLAASNFKEIVNIQGGADYSEDIKKIEEFSEEDVNRILNRVEEQALTELEKHSIIESLAKIKQAPNEKGEIQQLISHFFIQLSEIDKQLTEKEKVITQFIDSCNGYLEDSGKKLNYNNQNYKITISWNDKKAVSFSDLSSGEKQIVSVFSDLYLTDNKKFALIIDEPELSLSIGWQKRFLPDILNTGRCSFIASATHSPFIFENELDEYAHDIREYANGF